ncbi:OLC1v1035867C1 [Oldenlandia corymbosa var. corymbosa]|uniref:OLC1v1035867C1 n=1 Tax=Oldenlandia corymbosa var. corymbosa TaxID=529605 RepID=A0AAV1CV38_OLDCO|nr:OLC1v1035867C1 [Oldenlandia corymbosa var. corymbosa]
MAFSLLIPLLIFQFLHNKNTKPSRKPNPLGPTGLPFVGNLLQIDTSCMHEYLWELANKYGLLMSMKLGSRPLVVISSPRLAVEVLKNRDLVFSGRPKMKGQQKMSYNGLDIALAPYSQEWREMRKICILHLLSVKRVQQFRPIREDDVSQMISRIVKDATQSKVTNLSETMISVTSTMIGRIAFGKRLDEDGHEQRKFEELVHEVHAMFLGFFFSDYFPSLGWMDKITGINHRLERIFEKFDSFYQELINEHLDPDRPESMNDDIIDLMLQLQKDKSTSFDITMDHIKAFLMNVFLGGTDSSGIVVTWAMTALIKNPSVMKRLQGEIRQTMGNKEILDEDEVEKLPFLKATVKETLRLYPVAPLLMPRETLEKCKVDGYEIQPTWGIGRDPEIWENADEFRPDRFLNSDIDTKGQDYRYLPFGSGRRGCPGDYMGLITTHLLLANLLHSFDWELPPGIHKDDVETQSLPGFAMNKKNALKLLAKIPG